MPVLTESSYSSPWYAFGAHGQTILPNVSRRRIRVNYQRERIELADGDFIDIDWASGASSGRERCVVILHGLEGDSRAPYVKLMARALSKVGYAAAAFNLRGCSGEPNRKLRSYHSGCSDDLKEVLAALYPRFGEVYLIGYSLGGNIALKHLGEEGAGLDERLKAAVAISVPCDLESSARALEEGQNGFYMRRFIRMLGAKVGEKALRFPGKVDGAAWRKMRFFSEFDDFYTAPMNGFESALDYWTRCSSKPLLGEIARPSLLINARNDPFLAEACYPVEAAEQSAHLWLEMPESGGHCGFPGARGPNGYWLEERVGGFLDGAFGM